MANDLYETAGIQPIVDGMRVIRYGGDDGCYERLPNVREAIPDSYSKQYTTGDHVVMKYLRAETLQ